MIGRGTLFHGFIDGPQIAAVFLVLAGALLLRETKIVPRDDNAAPSVAEQTSLNAPSSENRGPA